MPAAPLRADAVALLARAPVFDAHVDSLQRMLDLGHDLGERGSREDGQLDLVRGREGGLGAVVLVCWVDPCFLAPERAPGDRAFLRAKRLLETAHALAERHPDKLRLVGCGAELAEARRDGVIAGIPGIEGGHAIEEDLDKLAWFHSRGLRVMTLVWNNHLSWIRSCQDGAGAHVPEGLSPFGRDVVRTMNELGIVVDLSHAGERSFFDTLDVTTRPVIASHSGCEALHAHPRNLTDDQLRALARNGGVVGIVFHPGFLGADGQAEDARVRRTDAYRALEADHVAAGGRPEDAELFLAQARHLRAHAAPFPAERLVEHVLHAIEVAGIEHVGLGSDYDGIQRAPVGLEDAACYGRLAELLLERGLGQDDVLRVLGGNMERVFAAVTA